MVTASLKRDHDLIEKVIKSVEITISLLQNNKKIPESILMPVIDFTKNFVDVCHHGKEENSLFPSLEKTGMPRHMGPIATMLMEHEVTKKIAREIEASARAYLQTNDSSKLVLDLTSYVEHIKKHLWKENNRLFIMAEMRLQQFSEQVEQSFDSVEKEKLTMLKKDRSYYEKLASDLDSNISRIN
jgi:hemerythrin-like domain-containing protein